MALLARGSTAAAVHWACAGGTSAWTLGRYMGQQAAGAGAGVANWGEQAQRQQRLGCPLSVLALNPNILEARGI